MDFIPVVSPWITIIEEAAETIGSEYHGKRSTSFGDTWEFNFHGSKTMTTGKGGMVTDRKHVCGHCLALRDHGKHRAIKCSGMKKWTKSI